MIHRESDKVNTSVGSFPVLMTDGTLFSVNVNNLKILSQEKGSLRGCFVIFFSPLSLHITTCPPTQKILLILSHKF